MTKPDISLQFEQLSIEQLNAIDLLVQGNSDGDVADAVGVSRQTVWTWRNKEPEFIAALNDERDHIWGSQTDRLRSLIAEAVDILADGLHSESESIKINAAIHILKAVGLYGQNLQPTGAKTIQGVKREQYWDSV